MPYPGMSDLICECRLSSTGALARYAFEMDAPCLGASGLLAMPTGAAIFGGRVRVAFRYFVPPLLLVRRPHLFLAAAGTGERYVFVVAALNKLWNAVAIVRRQGGDVYLHGACCRSFGCSLALTFLLSGYHGCLIRSRLVGYLALYGSRVRSSEVVGGSIFTRSTRLSSPKTLPAANGIRGGM